MYRKTQFERLESRFVLNSAPVAVADFYRIDEDQLLSASAPLHSVTDLKHHWTFDENEGLTAHDEVGSRHGALIDWGVHEASWVDGVLGGAIDFGDEDNYILVDGPIDGTHFTFSFWLKVRRLNSLDVRLISPQFQPGVIIAQNLGRGVGYSTVQGADEPEIDTWEHYALTVDDVLQQMQVFRNGQRVADGAIDFVNTELDWVLGHDSEFADHAHSLDGLMDDLRIYGRVLSDVEIQSLAQLPGVLSNDRDDDNNSLVAEVTRGVANGDLEFNTDGTFTYRPDDDFFGVDEFQYQVFDGTTLSDSQTVTIEVVGIPPEIENDDGYVTTEDQPLVVNAESGVLNNDRDEEGRQETLSAHLFDEPTYGSIELKPDGSFEYHPEQDFFGIDSFTYIAKKRGSIESEIARVSITVIPEYDPPIARNDVYETESATQLTVAVEDGVLQNDFGGDRKQSPLLPGNIVFAQSSFTSEQDLLMVYTPWGERVSQHVIPKPGDGSVRGVDIDMDGNVQVFNGTFDPRLSSFDPERETWKHQAVEGWSSVNRITTGGLATTGRFAFATDQLTAGDTEEFRGVIRFDLANGSAVRFADTLGDVEDVDMGRDGWLYVLVDSDCCESTLVAFDPETLSQQRSVTLPHDLNAVAVDTNGNIFGAPGNYVYDPDGNVLRRKIPLGSDADLAISPDGRLVGSTYSDLWVSDRHLSQIDVTVPRRLAVGIGNVAIVPKLELAEANTLETRVLDSPDLGDLVWNEDGSFQFTPDEGVGGSIRIQYEILSSGESMVSDQPTRAGTVCIVVDADRPTANDDHVTIVENAVDAPIDVLGNDLPGCVLEDLTVTSVTSGDKGGAVRKEGNRLFYTPKVDFFGVETFTYTVRLENGETSQGSVTVSVVENHPPTVVADAFFVYFSSNNQLDVLANDSSAPDENEILSITSVESVSDGATATIEDGKISYSPAPRFIGDSTLKYTVTDGSEFASAEVTIRVHSWQNLENPLDVNDDTFVTPIDILFVINELNRKGIQLLSPPPLSIAFVDVNDDGRVSPIDALMIINQLNRASNEGELTMIDELASARLQVSNKEDRVHHGVHEVALLTFDASMRPTTVAMRQPIVSDVEETTAADESDFWDAILACLTPCSD